MEVIWNATLYIWDCLSTQGLFSVNLEMGWAQLGMVLESSGQAELCLIGLAPGPGATLLWTDIQIDRFIFVFQSQSWGEGRRTYLSKVSNGMRTSQVISWVMHRFSNVNTGRPKSVVGKDFVPRTAEISRDALSVFTLPCAVSSFWPSSPFCFFLILLLLLLSITILDFETRTLRVAQTGIKLGTLLPLPIKCWDYRCGRPCLACKSFL